MANGIRDLPEIDEKTGLNLRGVKTGIDGWGTILAPRYIPMV